MLLSELLEIIACSDVINFKDCSVKGVTDNSENVRQGFVFVAIRGENSNGEKYIGSAIANGACAIVSENKIEDNVNNTIIVENTRKALAELLSHFHRHPDEKLFLIGITGTKGKTTTAEILYKLLDDTDESSVLIGTLGIKGLQNFCFDTGDNTTPRAEVIYSILDTAVRLGKRFVIIEVSSQALAQYRLYGIKFSIGIFTSFSEDHIGPGEHCSVEEYFSVKHSFFTDYGVRAAFINGDDEKGYPMTDTVEKVYSVGTNDKSDYLLSRIFSHNKGIRFQLNGCEFCLSMHGNYNAINASLALACASYITGLEMLAFSGSISSIDISGRNERYFKNGITVIIDFAHNAASFTEIYKSVKSPDKRLISVFGSVGCRSQTRRLPLALISEQYADLSIITSDNPGKENADDICLEIYSCFKDKRKAHIVVDRSEAVRFAIQSAERGDFVLLLGKGHEEYQLIGDKRVHFSERELLLSLGFVKI